VSLRQQQSSSRFSVRVILSITTGRNQFNVCCDGKEAEYAANIIAENMLSMCDEEGNQYLLMNQIVDHKKEENAVPKKDTFIWIRGRKYTRRPPRDGNFVWNGRMVPLHGFLYQHLRSQILWR
jgi:hypothetical protein